jgi:hypothetical protein
LLPTGFVAEVHRGTRIQRKRIDPPAAASVPAPDPPSRPSAHSGTSVPPPHLDEFSSVEEAPLRADEFATLGWI